MSIPNYQVPRTKALPAANAQANFQHSKLPTLGLGHWELPWYLALGSWDLKRLIREAAMERRLEAGATRPSPGARDQRAPADRGVRSSTRRASSSAPSRSGRR